MANGSGPITWCGAQEMNLICQITVKMVNEVVFCEGIEYNNEQEEDEVRGVEKRENYLPNVPRLKPPPGI